MKTNIKIRFKKEKGGSILNKIESLNLNDSNSVQELINELKKRLTELSYFEIVKEELYFGTQLMKSEEYVPNETGISLLLTVK